MQMTFRGWFFLYPATSYHLWVPSVIFLWTWSSPHPLCVHWFLRLPSLDLSQSSTTFEAESCKCLNYLYFPFSGRSLLHLPFCDSDLEHRTPGMTRSPKIKYNCGKADPEYCAISFSPALFQFLLSYLDSLIPISETQGNPIFSSPVTSLWVAILIIYMGI